MDLFNAYLLGGENITDTPNQNSTEPKSQSWSMGLDQKNPLGWGPLRTFRPRNSLCQAHHHHHRPSAGSPNRRAPTCKHGPIDMIYGAQ